ncbi:OmpA family protein [Hymenobacter sp. BT175]|uniref:OmpA family protein n=1 Tax=Hymenobacter translucens TaxID=2886507 RepID=UPI001D0E37D3|nr:OmpA family protein [Hymenobacter translucens]MCC2544965.1 OmpA family protein [Hymenobacter translucens]
MKRMLWLGLVYLLLAEPVQAQTQSLAGVWQGVETDPNEPGITWPALLRVQNGKGESLFGVLYQEATGRPGVTVTFQVRGAATPGGFRLEHVRKLAETGATPGSYWCDGAIQFTYNASEEMLTGRAIYDPVDNCDYGNFTLFRIKLKSAARVPAGAETTIRVSGRSVRWYSDPELKNPVASGNEFRTRLSKATTFYLVQNFYPTRESAVVPITIQVGAPVMAARPVPVPAPTRPAPQTPVRPAPAPALSAKPVVLPTVLFKVSTAELLPEAYPALDQLAAELRARPSLRLRVAGHTDRIGEPQKNLALSEQRAGAVKAYLVKAGIAAERISTIGYGDTRPLYPSPDARNRRVEVSEVQ